MSSFEDHTRWHYLYGLHPDCYLCRKANAEYMKDYRRRKRAGLVVPKNSRPDIRNYVTTTERNNTT